MSCVCLQYIASSWNHDGDPVELLQINESVSRFRQALKENPHFLQDKVRQYFKVTDTNCCDFFYFCVIISCPVVQMARNIFKKSLKINLNPLAGERPQTDPVHEP